MSNRDRATRLAVPAGLTLLVFVLCLASVRLRPAGSETAIWWPATGVGTAWLLCARPSRRRWVMVAVGVASAAANLVGGRSLAISTAFGVINVLEPLATVWWFTRGSQPTRRLRTVPDAARFVVASLLGAIVVGIGAGLTIDLLLDGSFWVSARTVVISHWAATLVISPLALVHTGRTGVRRDAVERVAQWLTVLAVTLAVFAPHQHLPLAFLTLPPLVWGAVRFSPRRVAGQLIVVGVIALLQTVVGNGPFAVQSMSPRVVVGLVQLFLIVASTVMLVLVLSTDERRRGAAEVAEREAMYRGGFADAMLGMMLMRSDGDVLRVVHLNDVAARLLADQASALVGTAWCRRIVAADLASFESGVNRVLDGSAPGWHGEVRMDVDGVERWMEIAFAPSGTVSAGEEPMLSVQLMDVTDRRASQDAMARMALQDPLTSLPNRLLLMDRIEGALTRSHRSGATFTLHFLDLDGFKPVNDAGGHAFGDSVLREVAVALRRQVRDSDTVARIGGDE
ncbi:MAG: diguanylate cyclase, partial [Actinomycetota bacterium]